jgi:hypothetical protein
MTRKFFYACLGIQCLVLAYHFGVSRSEAQSPIAEFAGISSVGTFMWAITVDGDVYYTNLPHDCSGPAGPGCPGWVLLGNVLGGPIPAKDSSFGAIKSRYRD